MDLKKQNNATEAVLDEVCEFDSLQAIKLYFQYLYMAKGEAVDKKKIIKNCKERNFRTVARDFKMIDSDTLPVYIPTAGNEALLDALRTGNFTAKTVRRLQKDSVNVYREQAQRLLGVGKVQQTEDGFLILADAGSYDPERGRCLCDAPGMDIFI